MIKNNKLKNISSSSNGQKDRYPSISQAKIDKCLNCTKPAKECKGNCSGV